MAKRRWVPGHWSASSGGYRQWIPGHYVGGTSGASVNVGSGKTTTSADDDTYHGASDEDLASRAAAAADAQIGMSRAEILRQQARARSIAMGDVGALRGLGEAQMGMLSELPARIQAIRQGAAQDIMSFGGQVASGEQAQLAGEQGAKADFVAQQTGGTAAAPSSADPTAVAAATRALGGTIPATSQEEIGASSAIAAAGMPAVVARGTQIEVAQRLAEAATEDADYRSQLVTLAATRGGVYQDALDHMYDIESKKFGKWEAEQRLKLDQAQLALQKRAQAANEKAMGVTAADKKSKAQLAAEKLALEKQKLQFAKQKEANDLKKAMAKGAKPDAALSKVYGYVVDSNGVPILNEQGQRIPVVKSSKATGLTPAQKASAARAAASAKAQNTKEAARDAVGKLSAGKIVKATKGRGTYVTAPGKTGGYPDGTTDDPGKAKYTGRMTFAQVISYLQTTYGLTKAEARKIAKAAGW